MVINYIKKLLYYKKSLTKNEKWIFLLTPCIEYNETEVGATVRISEPFTVIFIWA